MTVWILFGCLITLCLALDLGVFNKNAHVITNKEAAVWSGIWVSLATLFSIVVYFCYQQNWVSNVENLTAFDAALTYITGYLVELSLSVDNIFVIAVIFTSFAIPQKYQHRILFWGILGAIVFRAAMIFFGVALIQQFAWVTYLFGAFLIYTAFNMLLAKDDDSYNPKNSWVYKMVARVMPITDRVDGAHFFTKVEGKRLATPLLVALIVIEFTDVLFALDSIPAILGITEDTFLVFSSNIMAILGLRSMYFFLANMLQKFEKLKYSLVVILSFVGVKLILAGFDIHFAEWVSLAVIGAALLVGIIISLKAKDE